ncbi:hypothetical protein PIB30_044169 [Stylosanthes scabra]|uniref:Retrotransposon gag domain-containing protein n=1 Tax=Stylosanthes scabra TaxID=79078 RepID=A0ABU6XEX5_9FABA|nr:hypothetical protein [Stylosanthes scabra]
MADQRQTLSAEELFALVTTLQAELQQLHDSQNDNGRAHENDNGRGGGGRNGGGGGDDDGNNPSFDDIPNSDEGTDSQGSDNHNHTQQIARTTRTATHVSNSISDRLGEPNEELTPFSDEIMAFRMPSNFTLPTTLKAYDGIGDPKVHVTKFWSMILLNRSISSFTQLSGLFINHFAASSIYTRDSDYLSTITQGQHESLRDYMTRFTKVAIEIPDLSADVQLHA